MKKLIEELGFLKAGNTVINELQMQIVSDLCENDIKCMFDKMMASKLEQNSLGFWIWDVESGVEFYSPKFRESLGYEGEHDFPSVPKSWQDAIDQESLKLALGTLALTEQSRGEVPYIQRVKYYKKDGGFIEVLCHGVVTKWADDGKASVMIGVHMNEDYLFET